MKILTIKEQKIISGAKNNRCECIGRHSSDRKNYLLSTNDRGINDCKYRCCFIGYNNQPDATAIWKWYSNYKSLDCYDSETSGNCSAEIATKTIMTINNFVREVNAIHDQLYGPYK